MDTRWKKGKAICGFLSFALGVSLLLSALLPVAGNLVSEGGRERLENALISDFQETGTFRSYLSNVMNSFIAMGAGGPVGGSYYSSYDYSYDDAYFDRIIEATIVQEADAAAYIGDGSDQRTPTEADRELWKKDAEVWARQFQTDKNILYYITVDNRVAYTNMESGQGALPSFPKQGYHFRLSFNGSSCEAHMDGVPDRKIDLYGDGLYQEDGKHWFLPGYSNFQAGEGAEKVRVYLAVADEPALYVKGDFSSGYSQRQSYNRYYWHYQNWLENRQKMIVNGTFMAAAGLVLLILFGILRKEKRLADQAIARFTGRIWFEFKLVLLLGAVVLLLLPHTEDMRYLVEEVSYAFSIEDVGVYQIPWFFRSYLYEITRNPLAVILCFWILYLFVNDLRYGDQPWRNGIFGMLSAKNLKLPIQKRLSRSSGLQGLALGVLEAEVIFFLILQTLMLNLPLWSIWNLFLLPPLLALGIYLWGLRRQRRLAVDLGGLADQISAVRSGDLYASPLPPDSDLGQASRELAAIQQGMAQAVEEQTRSERMKVELVTNVSHDLKTPLTSIISYAELLKQEQLPPPAGEYVDILAQKAERLRAMVLDVFDVSKAASGNLPVKLEPLDLAKLLRQTVADMAEVIQAAPVILRQSLPEDPVTIVADGARLYRVFQNLLHNALQYALEGSRVYLSLTVKDGMAEASVKNTSKTELPEGVDYTARFVRRDQSRTDGGSGLGLAIADSFTRACGGELRVEPVADLFSVTVAFPLAEGKEG